MERATLASLKAPRIEQDDVEIEGVGVVTVRGLSRWELLAANKLQDKGQLVMERAMIAFAMVDPVCTEADVADWQKASPAGELIPLTKRINELSKVAKDSAKESYKSDGPGPDPGV